MKLIDAVKELVQMFWHDHTKPSSNQRDLLKLRKGSTEREPHVKHFLDTTKTKLYERFRNEHTQLNVGQRSLRNVNHGTFTYALIETHVVVDTM